MSTPTIQNFYYTSHLPARAVAIAQLSTPPLTPAQLTDISNVIPPAGLNIWRSSTPTTSPPNYVGRSLNQDLTISGSTSYIVDNPYFLLTDQSYNGLPLYYTHPLPVGVVSVVILDATGTAISTPLVLADQALYHNLDGAAYLVQYADSSGFLHKELLHYDLVYTQAKYTAGTHSYTFTGRTFTVATTGPLSLRFVQNAGYLVMPFYTYQSNTPWYARIRFPNTAPTPEYAQQVFIPEKPYVQANWVPGVVESSSIVRFERPNIYFNPDYLPDILVYASDYTFKYALEGTKPGSPRRRGTEFVWKRGLIQGIDATSARLQIQVQLAPTDIVYAFYSYKETDLIFTGLDLNPFTNPDVKDRVIQFYSKHNGVDPFTTIYYQVLDSTGTPIFGFTNDTAPSTGTNTVFSTLLVGANVSPNEVTITDSRIRGGGLNALSINIPEADSCWDVGYLDGRPYPIGGTLAVYIPGVILDTLTRTDVEARVKSCLPSGVLPVIRYYNSDGSEF